MAEIAVLVPVLERPERAAPLVESIREASTVGVRIVFLCTYWSDMLAAQEAGADEAITVPFALEGGDYARKINYGFTVTSEPWCLQAADDLRFHRGWDEEALRIGVNAAACVIGTNDLGNPLVKQGRHATHSLIRRSYVEELGTIDEPGLALHEGYWHCWVDNELVETAKHRRVYFAARRSFVEHLHHIWPDGHGGRKGSDDATYRRGQERYKADHALYVERRPLWRNVRRPL